MGLLRKDIDIIIQDLKDAGFTEMPDTYETLTDAYNNKLESIEKVQKEYEKALSTQARAKESINRINNKIANLKNKDEKNPFTMNKSKSFSAKKENKKTIKYYKKLLKSLKRKNKLAKISEKNLKKIIDNNLKDMKELKKDLKTYKKTLRKEYSSQKDSIKFLKEYNSNLQLIDKSCSKEVKAVLNKCIENMRNGEELPYGLTIKQLNTEFKLIKDSALKNKPVPKYIHIMAAAEQYKEDSTQITEKENNFKKDLEYWPAAAFTKYNIDRNKLETALQNSQTQDPVEFASKLGEMCIGKKLDDTNISAKDKEKMLLNKGLEILSSAIKEEGPKNMEEAKAYNKARNLISLNPNIEISDENENRTSNQEKGYSESRA